MNKLREGYKKTEIGIIPEDWGVNYLGTHSRLIDGDRGKNYPSSNDIVENGILFLSTANIKDNKLSITTTKFITQEKFDKLNKGKLKQKDIIITLRGTLGSIMIFETDKYETAFINAQMMIIRAEELIDYKFLYQVMISNIIKDQISRKSSGSAQPQLTKRDVNNLKIPIPPLPEQQRIAEILSTTDEHIENLDKTIEDYQFLKKGMMRKLLTEGIGHTEFKDTEIGRIPKEWEVVELKDLSNIVNGGTPKTNVEDYWLDGEILWATPTDITLNGKYINDTEKLITELGLKNSSAYLLPINSILMTSRATIGERCINTKAMSTNQGFKSFICKENCYFEYLYYYIEILKPVLIKNSSGSTFKEISKSKVEALKIALPPFGEQRQISEVLSNLDNKIELYQNQQQDYTELKKALMQQLLTGKIRTI